MYIVVRRFPPLIAIGLTCLFPYMVYVSPWWSAYPDNTYKFLLQQVLLSIGPLLVVNVYVLLAPNRLWPHAARYYFLYTGALLCFVGCLHVLLQSRVYVDGPSPLTMREVPITNELSAVPLSVIHGASLVLGVPLWAVFLAAVLTAQRQRGPMDEHVEHKHNHHG